MSLAEENAALRLAITKILQSLGYANDSANIKRHAAEVGATLRKGEVVWKQAKTTDEPR